jgi:hypothetical protein
MRVGCDADLQLRAIVGRFSLIRMQKYLVYSVAVTALLCTAAGRLPAQEMPGMPGMEAHHHHDEAATEKLGVVHFPVSCAASQQ